MGEQSPAPELNPDLRLRDIKTVLASLEQRVNRGEGLGAEETAQLYKVLVDLRDEEQRDSDERQEYLRASQILDEEL